MNLTVELAGVKLKNPVMNASGCLGPTSASLKMLTKLGAGAVVTKSISLQPNPGALGPIVVGVTGGILNHVGGANAGCEENKRELEQLVKELKTPVIASVEASEHYEETASVIGKTGVAMIELNISCAHRQHGTIGKDPKLTEAATKAVKEVIDVPLIVKLTPNVGNIAEIAKAAEKAGADVICAVNTLGPGMVIDIETGRPVISGPRGTGGMSGPAIKPIVVRCVADIAKCVDIPIIGVGGISNGRDAIEMMMAGASTIQIGTAIIYEGLGVFQRTLGEIEDFMKRKGYTSLDEIVGLALKSLG